MDRPLRTVVSIGNFDGVHIGHIALIRHARMVSERQPAAPRVVAMCFDPHPLTRLNPAAAPARLTTFERRAALLRDAGADEVIRLAPTARLLSLSVEEFVRYVVEDLRPIAIVEGPDFRFGKGRAGGMETLAELGSQLGFETHTVPSVEAVLNDGTLATASSSLARWLIAQGRMIDAASVLGRWYEVEGTVERGDQRGRQLGYPTANLKTDCLLPADGVYGGAAMLPHGREVPAAISVGSKPMFNGSSRVLEAHLLGEPDLSGLPEYGWPLRVRVSRWIRDQLKFDSINELIRQMADDCRRAQSEGATHA